MPESGPERAYEVAETIRKNIEKHPIPIGDKTAKITISIGVSSYPLHADYIHDKEDFIKLADEALYICKHRGRNCVSLYEEKPEDKAEEKPQSKPADKAPEGFPPGYNPDERF